jgi:hypothetical protein
VSYRFALGMLMSLLVLAASADDFNLMRVAFPSAWVSIPLGSVLEDDENSDFLGAEQEAAPVAHSREASDTPAVARQGPDSRCPAPERCRQPGALPSSALSRTSRRTPLRC